MSAPVEAFSALSPAAVGGRRRKLKLVTKKQARKMLKKLGHKMRGGAETAPVAVPEAMVDAAAPKGGKRTRRHSSVSRRRSSSMGKMFGL